MALVEARKSALPGKVEPVLRYQQASLPRPPSAASSIDFE